MKTVKDGMIFSIRIHT